MTATERIYTAAVRAYARAPKGKKNRAMRKLRKASLACPRIDGRRNAKR